MRLTIVIGESVIITLQYRDTPYAYKMWDRIDNIFSSA